MLQQMRTRGLFGFVAAAALCLLAGCASQSAYAAEDAAEYVATGNDPHADLFAEESYPSAAQCANCHGQIYKEWAASSHAYSSISPMFHKFEQAANALTQGTMGSFCVRCHQQVGTQRGEPRELPLWERSVTSREGVTCITCHRIAENYGKVNGERSIVPGNIHTGVYGTKDNSIFQEILDRTDELKLATDSSKRGVKVHSEVIEFAQIGESEFCVSCHQVAVNLGIKLEVVWEQYRASPAHKQGISCQDCHMGKDPGLANGYEKAATAIVNGEAVNPGRKHSNHTFYGPGYSIAHPGIFPHNPAAENWSIKEWLQFDYRAGWGTEEFEANLEDVTTTFEEVRYISEDAGLDLIAGGFDAMDRSMTQLGWLTGRDADLTETIDELRAAIDDLNEGLATEFDAEPFELIADELNNIDGLVPEEIQPVLEKAIALFASPEATNATESLSATLEAISASLDRLQELSGRSAREELLAELHGLMMGLQQGNDYRLTAIDALVDLRRRLNVDFPAVWADAVDREDANEIIQANLETLTKKEGLRKAVMENGSKIDGPFFKGDLNVGKDLEFEYVITNTNSGHNLPSGSLGAQPELWLNVALIDPNGKNIWESGYLDSNGDFADLHSLDYLAGKIPRDSQLFNLQTKFLTTNVKGTEREMYLPVQFDVDQIPHLRPSNVPTTVLNHPPLVRMEQRSIPPLGSRTAPYEVPGELLSTPGTYRLAVRLRSRAEPIYFMRFVGATKDMEQSMNEWMIDIHEYAVEFEVK